MEVLLNPNVAYILLVAGFSLTVMAILAPGTGLLEILALFTLVLAGYGVYNIPFNWWALVLLILGVVPFILALRKFGNLLFLFISILAMVIGSSFLFRGETWYVPAVNPILAVVVSLMTASYFWIALSKILEAEHNRPTHDLSTLIGMTGEAKSDIQAEGSVQVDGELWSATSQELIPTGSFVRIKGREGFILEVEKLDKSN
jgi:membrane-bound ClpP family serine protease